MVTGNEISDGHRRMAAELLQGLIDALPIDGPRDAAVRKAVEQRAAALYDLSNFQAHRESDSNT